MGNQLFRTIMPYKIELNGSVFRIFNRGGVELFCCKMRKCGSLIEMMCSVSHNNSIQRSNNVFVSYLYSVDPYKKNNYDDYMNRCKKLLDYMDKKSVWNPGYEYGNALFPENI